MFVLYKYVLKVQAQLVHDPAVYAGSPGCGWVEVVVAGVRVRVDHLHVYSVDIA